MERKQNEYSGAPATSDSFAVACFCALIAPAALWAYDGRIVLAATAATFVAVYLLGRAVGLAVTVVSGMHAKKRVKYVSRKPFDSDRRLGYVSADAVCRAAKGGRK